MFGNIRMVSTLQTAATTTIFNSPPEIGMIVQKLQMPLEVADDKLAQLEKIKKDGLFFSLSIVPPILNIPVSFTCLQSRTDVGVAEQLRHLINKKCNWTKRKLTAKFTEEKDQAKKYIHFIERFHL